MKFKILNLVAVVVPIIISSFSTHRATLVYLIYDGGGTQKNIASYSISTSLQSHSYTSFSPAKLNWFRAIDFDNNGILSPSEFNASFEDYDQVQTITNLLSDEAQDVLDELDLEHKILP